ncbi:MAG: YcnI family protein [Microcella sp.]|uniref:YcnI family protein n=1 Tax=Microcella sp. TaxID=1913979 RepID=UPI003314CF19
MKNRTRITAAALAGGLLALAAPVAAQAHVTATATSDSAGSYTVVTFSVPHGCDGSPTQIVTIDIPESIPSVTPTVNPLWSVEKVMVPLEEPLEAAEGAEPVTERIGQVVYTSTTGGLADGFRDSFALSLRLPDGAPGDTVEFPVTQTCDEGTAVWEGEDVPLVTLAASTGDGHSHGDDTEMAMAETASTETDAVASTTQPDVLARVLGALGILVGAGGLTAAILARRSARTTAEQ